MGSGMAVYYLNRKGELVLSLFAKEPRVRRRDRPRCGAKTRRGTRCRAPAVWDRAKDRARNGRCKLHGGLSTGPRTTAGRDAIRASNRLAYRGKGSHGGGGVAMTGTPGPMSSKRWGFPARAVLSSRCNRAPLASSGSQVALLVMPGVIQRRVRTVLINDTRV